MKSRRSYHKSMRKSAHHHLGSRRTGVRNVPGGVVVSDPSYLGPKSVEVKKLHGFDILEPIDNSDLVVVEMDDLDDHGRSIYEDIRGHMSGVEKDIARKLGINTFIVEYGEDGSYPVIMGTKEFHAPRPNDEVYVIRRNTR